MSLSEDLEDGSEWHGELKLRLTPVHLAHSMFYSARQVHTGRQSCIEPQCVVFELNAADAGSGHHVRFVEQEYASEEEDGFWHDWTVEVCIGDLYITAHWQVPMDVGPADWDWCLREAEKAFERACLLLGKRVRKGMVVEEMGDDPDNMGISDARTKSDRSRHH